MKKMTAMSGVAITVVAFSLALVGCSSNNTPAAQSSSSASSATNSTTSSSTVAQPPGENAPGPNPTIATYIQQNGIVEAAVHKGDPGSPTIDVPVPPGWQDAGTDTPDWAYSMIKYTGPEAAQYAPQIFAIVSKLSGNVDPQKIIEFAPGELNNLSGFKPTNQGAAGTLGGFPAYQLAGTWVDNGQTKVVAQQTVVISGNGGVYVLQLNADGLDTQADVVSAATDVIDQQTTITP